MRHTFSNHAKTVWRAVNARMHGYTGPLPDIKLDYYTVQSIDINGTIKVGCHTIKFPELYFVAGILGVRSESYINQAPVYTAAESGVE